ncbi:hypothetical protein BH20ACT18_BH20ACT18_14120 [soil metagenome]
MALGTRAWITAARARRRLGKPSREAWARDRRSFADIGGLFGIHGDVALQAEEHGATEGTLYDAGDATPEFRDRREREGSRIRFVQGDLEDPVALERVGTHDLVWCVGVIYHTPMLGHGNFWWGISPSALRAMLPAACFEVVEERHPHAYPFYTEVVARPVARHPSVPPISYYRERGEAADRGDEPPPFTDYYE